MKNIIRFSLFLLISITAATASSEPVSGFEFMQPDTRAMQLDDFENPGMTAVEEGRALFSETGFNDQNCASCHGEDGEQLDPKRIAQYPIYSHKYKRPLTLQNQLNICWQDRLNNDPLIYDSHQSVVLETFVRHLARGEKVNVDVSGPMNKYYLAGQEFYNTRFGQLDMACVHCHDYYQGQFLRGQRLSQGQGNGFPIYRLGTGKITSLHQRLSECFVSFRAQPFDRGSEDLINLEVYLYARGNGLKIETPAVRY